MASETQATRWVIETASEAETRAVAAALADGLAPADVLALEGPLGAGKTTFVRGLCEGLQVPREAGVSSPTYTLIQQYSGGRLEVAHVDLYRIGDEDELEALGFRDLLDGDALIVVEWPRRAAAIADVASCWIQLEDRGPDARRIQVTVLDVAARASLAAALERYLPADPQGGAPGPG